MGYKRLKWAILWVEVIHMKTAFFYILCLIVLWAVACISPVIAITISFIVLGLCLGSVCEQIDDKLNN